MPILTEQRERRDVQPIPVDAAGAEIKFVCGVYRCTLTGAACRDYHVHAVEFRPENREACIDCPAGIARAKLLGLRGSTFIRPEMCQGKTAKGAPCTNVAATDGLCHGCKGNAASRSVGSANARSAAWNGKRKAKAAADAPAKSAASPKKRPWMVKSGAHGITQTAPASTCIREGCDRPTVPGTALSEYCRECVNTAYTSLRKSSGRTPTNAERAEWLASHPAMVKCRRRGAEAAVPNADVAPADVPVPVLDVCGAVSPEVVDTVLVRVVEVVEVVEVVTELKREPLTEQRFAELVIEGEEYRRSFDGRTDGSRVPPFGPDDDAQFAPRTTPPPAPSVTPAFAPETDGGNAERTAPAGVGMGACPTAISEMPDHLVLITIPLNRCAYAELKRMAVAGLHGDDPCDAARTLILEGLRRHAMVRL